MVEMTHILSDAYRFELRRAGFTERQINTLAQKFYNLYHISPFTNLELHAIWDYPKVVAELTALRKELGK